ncbi:MAG: hypothetical protein HY238_17125 [Acidobacteria bacterium]|nr:hypothetical protein [Acidobacteriota bacterium]
MIKRLTIAAALLAVVGFAEQKTVSGYLIDKACSADALKKGEKVAKEHGVDCALMDDCAKSGYGVYTSDGKFIAFDTLGNKRAMAALKTSKKKSDIQVTVTGDVSGDSMKVASLKLN